MGIGDVLAALRPEFPDVTISKIRFLESEGLVQPRAHVERLPQVQPRRRRAAALRPGLPARPVPAAQGDPRPPRGDRPRPRAAQPASTVRASRGRWSPPTACRRRTRSVPHRREVRLSRGELLEASGLDDALLTQLEGFGLITKRGCALRRRGRSPWRSTVAEMAAFGIEPRHLRTFKVAADREVGLVEQVVTPLLRQRDPEGQQRADDAIRQLAVAVGAAARGARQGRARRRAAPLRRTGPVARVASHPLVARVDACARWTSWVSASRCRRTSRSCCCARSRGSATCPIWIGAVEATAIAFAQQGVVPARPADPRPAARRPRGARPHPARRPHHRAHRRRLLRRARLRRRRRGERPAVRRDRARAAHRDRRSTAPTPCSTRPGSPCPTSRRTRWRSSASSSTRSRPDDFLGGASAPEDATGRARAELSTST